jgi:hypothetical protein
MSSSNITDNMHDLVEHFKSLDSYHDFEGMADAKAVLAVLAVCRHPESQLYVWEDIKPDRVPIDLARSLLLAHLYERSDTYQLDDLKYTNVVDLWELLLTVLSCRWWSKVTGKILTQIEQSTPTDEGAMGEDEGAMGSNEEEPT